MSFLIHPREIKVRYVATDSETEKKQTSLKNQGRQIKCWRTGYESTTKKKATREIRATKKKVVLVDVLLYNHSAGYYSYITHMEGYGMHGTVGGPIQRGCGLSGLIVAISGTLAIPK